ncbi:MAG: carbohydrate ABC transporter permease [Haloferacaceae archaeon]|jgi:multiple sugar transport system permease protein
MATGSGADKFTFERSGSRYTWEDHYKPVLKYVFLGVFLAWILLPVYYTGVNSLKGPGQIFQTAMGIPYLTFDPLPFGPLLAILLGEVPLVPAGAGGSFTGLSAWRTMWEAFPFVEYLLATTVVSVGTAGLATVAAVFSAYAFARLEFPAKTPLFILSVMGFTFPIVLLAIPIFVLMQQLSLLNTYLGMILAFTAFTLPYNIWLLRGFFEDLPANLEESARVDGCTQIGAFFRVILPLSRPAIASVFLLAFLLAWHNYLMAFILGSDPLHTTLAPAILQLRGTFFVKNLHYIMAGTFLSMFVPILMYMYLQTHLVEGLSSGGGVKG